jgi:NADH:ubiquinone oxidoreductase subunit H
LLQPVADGIKLFFKEELIRTSRQAAVRASPGDHGGPVLILLAVVPLGPDVTLFGRIFT